MEGYDERHADVVEAMEEGLLDHHQNSEVMEEGYDDERHADAVGSDSAFTSWNTLSADTAAHGLLRGRHYYSSSLSSSYASSLRSTCRRPDGMIVKATYGRKIIRFGLPLASSLVDLEENVTERLLELKDGTFRIKYQDDEGDWILITDDDDLQFCMASLRSVDQNTILMLIEATQHSQTNRKQIYPRTLALCDFAIFLVFVLIFCMLWACQGRFIDPAEYRSAVRKWTWAALFQTLPYYPYIISFIARRHKSRSKLF